MQYAHYRNDVARQIAINAYKLSSSNYARLCNSGESRAYLERVFVWNITSTTLGYLDSNYNYYPTTTVSGGGTLFIGRTETDEGTYNDSLLDGDTIASSTFVAQMLTKGYNKVYVGTCKLGSYEFVTTGYIETAGTFVSNVETITIPTVDEITATVSAQIQAMSAEEREAYEKVIADGIATAKAEMEAREATLQALRTDLQEGKLTQEEYEAKVSAIE